MRGIKKQHWRSALVPSLFIATTATGGVAAFIIPDDKLAEINSTVSTIISEVSDTAVAYGFSNCNIKGNISVNTDQKIYHVPGQMFYSETRIRTDYGERWFCTEADAIKAGWRKARR